jgi:protein MPE1
MPNMNMGNMGMGMMNPMMGNGMPGFGMANGFPGGMQGNANAGMWGGPGAGQGMGMNNAGTGAGVGQNMNMGPANPRMNGNNGGYNPQQQHGPGFKNFSHQPADDEDAYFRKPVNPHRHQNRQRRARPSDYREL